MKTARSGSHAPGHAEAGEPGRDRQGPQLHRRHPPAITAARSFGDLSHNVFSAVDGPEILIIDFWNNLTGLGQFFSTPDVQAGADMLFTERDATVWAPTTGYGDFHLLAPSQTPVSAVGIIRVNVTLSAITKLRGEGGAAIT